MITKNDITQSIIKNMFSCDPSIGDMIRIVKTGQNTHVGDVAGYLRKDGYRHISINGKQILNHRIVWIYFNGEIPNGMDIDHINGIKSDNRLCNLRLTTRSENCQNRLKTRTNNKSGVVGVCWHKDSQKWTSQIMAAGKVKYLGCFDDIDNAIEARLNAEKIYYQFSPRVNNCSMTATRAA